MKVLVSTVAMLLAATPAAWAEGDTPSSPAGIVQRIQSLERAPLAEDAPRIRSELIDWAASTTDASITICDILGPVPGSPVPHAPILFVQAMLGNGAFQLEHPESRNDEMKAQLAGIRSMLRAYEAILLADPAARIPEYDAWLADMQAGRLERKLRPRIRRECLPQRRANDAAAKEPS